MPPVSALGETRSKVFYRDDQHRYFRRDVEATKSRRSGGDLPFAQSRQRTGDDLPGDGDLQRFEELLAEESRAAGVELYAWRLMPTHWHLVARPNTPGQIAPFMRRLVQRHTRFWHKVRGTRGQGHLYQGRAIRHSPCRTTDIS